MKNPAEPVTVVIHGRKYENIRADRVAWFKRRIRAIDAAAAGRANPRHCKSPVRGHMQAIDRNR